MEQKLSPRRQVYDRGLRALLWVCIGMVMAAETFNTAIEKLCDVLDPTKPLDGERNA